MDKDVAIWYDMSMKEFEQPTIHDLFKVFFFVHNHLWKVWALFFLSSHIHIFFNVGHV